MKPIELGDRVVDRDGIPYFVTHLFDCDGDDIDDPDMVESIVAESLDGKYLAVAIANLTYTNADA